MALLTGSRCELHPQDAAQQACAACGRLTCSQCLVDGRCARCAAPAWEAPPSTRADQARSLSVGAVVATVVGLLAIAKVLPRELAALWPLGLITGIIGFVMANAELGAIARGERPASGRKLVVTARRAAAAHVLFVVLFFVALFALGVLQGLASRR